MHEGKIGAGRDKGVDVIEGGEAARQQSLSRVDFSPRYW